jgi:arylsulfatase A-like enzyme
MNHLPRDEKLSRRGFLKTSGAALGAGLISLPKRTAGGNAQPPNILIILSDQEREDVPRQLLRLPHRAGLERRGIRLTQAFVAAPQCSPSRSTLLTGLYPHQAGVVTNVDRGSLGRQLSPTIPTLGKVFQGHGYPTAYLGKWHLSDNLGDGTGAEDDSSALKNYGFGHYHSVAGAQLAEAAADWISKAPSRPWLLIVSFPHETHDIYRAPGLMPKIEVRPGVSLPPNFEDDLHGKPVPQKEFLQRDQGKVTRGWGEAEWLRYRSYYLSQIEILDGYVGTILEPLQRRRDADDTIVVYSSDHGDMGGAHRLPFKGPFMYDELLRVPLVISCPRRFGHPVVSDSMVSSVDLVPTLSTMAGIEWPSPLPGKDFSLLFDYPKETIHAAVFAEYYGKQHWVNPIRTLRTADWKYNLYVAPGRELAAELYDLKNDPGEVHNLVDRPEYQKARQQVAANLLAWRRSTNDPML